MVATFFAFLNDSVSSDTAKRAYGLIILGGVVGGAFGSLFVATKIREISYDHWIMICLGILLIIVAVATIAGRMVNRKEKTQVLRADVTQKGNPAFEGAKLVLKSRYLLSIVGIVGLYEMVSQIMDFQFTQTIAYYLDGDAIGQQIATGQAIGTWTALIVQLFLTSFVMSRFGVGTALLFLPVAALSWSTIYLAAPILWVGTLLFTADNGFSYSINQSAKESLYVPTSKDEKYKAKAFIDMFIQRFAKVLAIGLSLIITTIFTAFNTFRWLSLLTAVILVIWIIAARYAGKRFAALTSHPAQ
jgi:AAA family ATP:ADP antiporter